MKNGRLMKGRRAAPEAAPGQGAIAERAELAAADCWDLEDLYATVAAWEQELAGLEARVVAVEAFKDRLTTPAVVADCQAAASALDVALHRLHLYAHLEADQDTRRPDPQDRLARIRARGVAIGGRMAWIEPELLRQPVERLAAWLHEPLLAPYRYLLRTLLRTKPHVRTAAEEQLLAESAELRGAPARAFTLLTNADLRFRNIRDAQGRSQPVSEARFRRFLENRDRALRRRAYRSLLEGYRGMAHGLGYLLAGSVKAHNFMAQARHFPSARAAALHGENVPDTLYDALVSGVRASLPSYHRYQNLRADRLGLNRLHAYDSYVPLIAAAAPREIPFAEARAWLCAACAPLGGAYLEWLERAFRERWIDVYENRGKVSGAYSSACYGSKPYVLLNYQGRLHDVFTLAHELGHAVHTALANEAQPAHLAHYPIFLAEIASTCTEELLLRYLLRRFAADPEMSALLLNQACDAYRGTVVRQTLFADFEHQIHELDAQGVALTPASLSRLYNGLNRHYQGPRFVTDAHSDAEWLRIPHFHYNFYVYKYATSFCAAQIFATRLEDDPAWREAYLELLRAGGSAEPLELLRAAGVDLEQPQAFNEAAARFVERLEDLCQCFSEQSSVISRQ